MTATRPHNRRAWHWPACWWSAVVWLSCALATLPGNLPLVGSPTAFAGPSPASPAEGEQSPAQEDDDDEDAADADKAGGSHSLLRHLRQRRAASHAPSCAWLAHT